MTPPPLATLVLTALLALSAAVASAPAAPSGNPAQEEGSHAGKFIAGLGVTAVGVAALTAGARVVAVLSRQRAVRSSSAGA